MSRIRCSVCDKKFAVLKRYYCDLCQCSFSLCGRCETFGRDYVKSPQPQRSYCPQCNEKLRGGDLRPATNGELVESATGAVAVGGWG